MEKSTVLQLLVYLALTVFEINGECVLHSNRGTKEYRCLGGDISDLNSTSSDTSIIRISKMKVTRLSADVLNRFGSTLQVFSCSHCGIREIDSGAFKNNRYLEQLVLDGNDLTSVKSDWFLGVDYITYLDLSYNEIEEIEAGVYERLPYLAEFRLSGNRIKCLDTKALSAIKTLKRVFVVEMPAFKCPNIVSEYFEKNNILMTTDAIWKNLNVSPELETAYHSQVQNTPAKKLERIETTTNPPDSQTAFQDTLVPKLTSEDVDVIAVLTTNSLPQTPESSSPKPIVPSVIDTTILPITTPRPELPLVVTKAPETSTPINSEKPIVLANTMTATERSEPTVAPVVINPVTIVEIHKPPETTLLPILASPVPPTGGEPPIGLPEVQSLDESGGNFVGDNSPDEYRETSAEGSTVAAIVVTETDKPLPECQNFGAPSHPVNKYSFAIIVAGFILLQM